MAKKFNPEKIVNELTHMSITEIRGTLESYNVKDLAAICGYLFIRVTLTRVSLKDLLKAID